ncbi:mitochondrial arginine transporter BAC1 [Impatiens glandulifera]|uniref:mitochondrial arginine transporter BAC1 n=1 Tax=Impatiens glandulifera TaxID=253017 RepID=UPI001FB0A885|nr:mitochondrial arginine transporter BAC1 [Impatiens glandulifera]XP_047310615.1 mitochondrial arginine transporter BAC1 [Impatiens glandulifera]
MEQTSGYKDYIAGLLAGVAIVVTGHPFDTVKVKLQKHNTDAQGARYRNGLHCTARILKTEGVKGLYRGASSSFVGMAFESSLLFGMYSQIKQSLQGELQSDKPHFSTIIPAASFSGAAISFILCPTELVKCRMQVQGTDSLVPMSNRYSGPLDCAIKTMKHEGVAGIFRGGLTTLFRESIGNAAFFCTYEHVKYYMNLQFKDAHKQNNLVDVGIGIMSGGLSGIAFWSAVLPLDVAKTLIQTDPDRSSTKNPFQILTSIHRRSGLSGCYTGLGPTIMRAFPANAAAIVTWELAIKFLGIKHD